MFLEWGASLFPAGFVGTGTLRGGAAYGALSGAVFGGIGGAFKSSSGFFQQNGVAHVAAHAAAGGVLSKLQGGKFGHGFLTAGIMKGVGWVKTGTNAPRVIVQAIAGGTVSRLTSGKFANGAITSAIQYVVNKVSSSVAQEGFGSFM
ncbi:hypothetical protein ACRRS0_13765 [Agarivorans sp. QJM3NY_29]|uniref:hypothetical protein n=1 Tax=unclassified Agarivorans TaxID=2636026 RepID=UPI003D7D307B